MKSVNPVVFGSDRYTVLCPECVRIEHSKNGVFVDDPSLFVTNRKPSFDDFEVRKDGDSLTIETSRFKLVRKAGEKLDWNALRVEVKGFGSLWRPGMGQSSNLGGSLATLDGVGKARALDPGLLSRDGWTLVDDSKTHLLHDGWLANRPEGAGTDWLLFVYGSDYKAALKALTEAAGPVPMPRKAVLGSWYSRWWKYTSKDFRNIVEEYERNGFPLDILVMDMDWHRLDDATDGTGWAFTKGWTGWSWNRELLPDAEELLKWLKERKLSVTLNVHPHDGVRKHEDMYKPFMAEMGADSSKGDYLLFDAGDKKYMDAFFKHTHKVHEDAGVDFWWLDWQQDSIYPNVKGFPGLTHLQWLNNCYYEHTSEDGKRGLSFSRWAGWGDHRHPIHFSGDAVACWDMLAFEVPFTASSGNVGCFFWSHDMGGFYGERDEELYARWLQFGAVTAAMRCHSCGDALDRRPWKWSRKYMESMRKSFNLRASLMPSVYSFVEEACSSSLPLIRPMYIEHPKEEAAYRNPQQFYFGSSLLAAPVSSKGVGPAKLAFQSVWFPEGEWFNLVSGERFEGPCERVVAADIDETPLFVKGGAPLPSCAPALRMTSEIPAEIVVLVHPAKASGRFSLYEDDGVTTAFKGGSCARTSFSYSKKGSVMKLSCGGAKGSFDGFVEKRSYVVEFRCVGKPRKASVDGAEVAFDYDRKTRVCRVRTGLLPIGKGFVATLDAAPDFGAALDSFKRRLAPLGKRKTPELELARLLLSGVGPVFKNETLNLASDLKKLKFHFKSQLPGRDVVAVEAACQRKTGSKWETVQTVKLSAATGPAELPAFNDGDFGVKTRFAKPSRILFKISFKKGAAKTLLLPL